MRQARAGAAGGGGRPLRRRAHRGVGQRRRPRRRRRRQGRARSRRDARARLRLRRRARRRPASGRRVPASGEAAGQMTRLWPLAQGYWFDGVIVFGLGIGLASTVVDYGSDSGPRGPLWFDVPATVVMITLLFARRRFPIGALLAIAVTVSASTFVDGRLVSDDFVIFCVGLAVCFLFGMRPSRLQSLGGLALLLGTSTIVNANDPTATGIGNYVFNGIAFVIAWIIGCAVAGKGREVQEARERAERAEREREDQ